VSQDIEYGRYAYKYGNLLFYHVPDNPAERHYVFNDGSARAQRERQEDADSKGKRVKHGQDADKIIFFRDAYGGYAASDVREKIFMREHRAFGIAGRA